MTTLLVTPLFQPFPLNLLESFWNDENASMSAFSTGVRRRDGDGCVIGGCEFDLAACVDDALIIPRDGKGMVRTPNMPFKWFANLYSENVSKDPNTFRSVKGCRSRIRVTEFASVKYTMCSLMPIFTLFATSPTYLPPEY
jgi:hypothetical protein